MQVISVFVAISIFIGMLFTQNQHTLDTNAKTGEATAVSGNLEVYRNLVVSYARSNPGVTGAVSDASLGLPTWFVKINGVSNYVAAGKGYVYYATNQPETAYLILKSSNNSIHAGLKRGGFLYNPLSGTTTITLPAAIPDGSVVYGDG